MNRIGVVIPTRNSAERLSMHLDSMDTWLDAVAQVVVVDSESIDGTEDILRERIKHPNLKFLRHPPGLYPSWNYGLHHLETEWAYVSTIGDTISRSHLLHLAAAADTLECDLICSPPQILRSDGSEAPRGGTPSQTISEELGLQNATVLTSESLLAYAVRFAFVHGMNTPIGSSASNLYRCEFIKRIPFPSQYGSAGDFFWLLENAAKVRFGITPRQGSTFLLHPNQHAQASPDRKLELARLAAKAARAQIAQLRLTDSKSAKVLDLTTSICDIGELTALVQHELEVLKTSLFGKLKSAGPRGWKIRSEKKQLRAQLKDLESNLTLALSQG